MDNNIGSLSTQPMISNMSPTKSIFKSRLHTGSALSNSLHKPLIKSVYVQKEMQQKTYFQKGNPTNIIYINF